MRKGLKIILTGLSAVALVSCTEETPQPGPAGGEIPLRIEPRIVEASADGATRARIKGTEFTVPVKLGLSITPQSTASTMSAQDKELYKNFHARNYPGPNPLWQYVVKDTDDKEFNVGSIVGYSDWETIDVVGYHPYDPDATDLSAIPFRLVSPGSSGDLEGRTSTTVVDYMVADQVVKDMRQGDDIPLYLSFHHTMTSIELRIMDAGTYSPPDLFNLRRVTFEIEGGREFVVAGTYDAVAGAGGDAVNAAGRETATKMTVIVGNEGTYLDGRTYITIPLVIMPELRYSPSTPGLGDATVKMTFYFFDLMGKPYLFRTYVNGPRDRNPEISFKLSDVQNGSGNDSGLLRGRNYAVTADIREPPPVRSAASEQPEISFKVAPTLSATPM